MNMERRWKLFTSTYLKEDVLYTPDRKAFGVREEAVSYRWLLHCLLRRLNPANLVSILFYYRQMPAEAVLYYLLFIRKQIWTSLPNKCYLFIDTIQKWTRLIIHPLSKILTMCMWRGKMIPMFSCIIICFNDPEFIVCTWL